MRAALSMPVSDFCRSVKTNKLFVDLERAFFSATGRSVGQAERASWLGSLPRLCGAIEIADLPGETFIGLEVQIPYYSERIDAVLYGHDAGRQPFAVLVELKQWSDAALTLDGRLAIAMRSGLVQVVHPSFQVDGYRRLLGPDLAPLVRFTDFFWEYPENSVDVLIVDEAHRIRAKSVPKVVAARRPKISQLEELVRASRVTVLFMDTNQIIQPDESGDPDEVAALASRLGIRLTRHRLRAQFRCDGSGEYLSQWSSCEASGGCFYLPSPHLPDAVHATCHQMCRALEASEGEAGALLARMPDKQDGIRQLAYRLYTLCERKGWAEEARSYNDLVTSWPAIVEASQKADPSGGKGEQLSLV